MFPAPRSSSTLQQWDDFSQFNKNLAETEMKAAVELREAVALTIAEVTDPSHTLLFHGRLVARGFPVGHVASPAPQLERFPQMATSLCVPLPCLPCPSDQQ